MVDTCTFNIYQANVLPNRYITYFVTLSDRCIMYSVNSTDKYITYIVNLSDYHYVNMNLSDVYYRHIPES